VRLPQRRFALVGAEAGNEPFFQTPASALPLRKKQMQPNVFFSSTPFFRARASRMRAARDSSKAIGDSVHSFLKSS
jgi:hypothetical protein